MQTILKEYETQIAQIDKVLIANRGEIAVRIVHACRSLGIPSVAIYSTPDRTALHVRSATEAYEVGPAALSESYLNIEKIIAIAKESGANAIHPGYGFLSENARFARRLQEEGIILIGPPARAMELMGTKTEARRVMAAAGVPIVPGLERGLDDVEEAIAYAQSIQFPVMLKAAAGGGGRGMRRVDRVEDFKEAWLSAKSEAQNAFGDDEVYIEKFLQKPRHIEIQVFADAYGRVHSLFERECSVQRRHQKIIEEAPSPFVTNEMRVAMGEVACKAARAVGYLGAGTVEFLVDAQRNFYFMEINTHLQVEHPVTECITGFDLVTAQILVAQGQPLPWGEAPQAPYGWAVEARLCAEDPDNGFVPTPGTIQQLREPTGPGIRVDTGVYRGFKISPDYDSMMAKVIAWGRTRDEAIARLRYAVANYTVKGTTTNAMFLRRVLESEEFASGTYDTGIVERLIQSINSEKAFRLEHENIFASQEESWIRSEHERVALLATAFMLFEQEQRLQARVEKPGEHDGVSMNSWKQMTAIRSNIRWS